MTSSSPLTPAEAGTHPSPTAEPSQEAHSISPALHIPEEMGPGVRRDERRMGLAVLAYALAGAVVLLDQLSKAWVLYGVHLRERVQVPVLPPIFNLTFVWNSGFSFGVLRDVPVARWGLTVFSAVVVVAVAIWARKAERALTALWMGLIMGGATGNNLIDRVRFGAVVDFLDFGGLHFPWVFNVADSAISIGVCVMLLDSFRAEPKRTPA